MTGTVPKDLDGRLLRVPNPVDPEKDHGWEHVSYQVFGAGGEVSHVIDVPVHGRPVIHDMALTQRLGAAEPVPREKRTGRNHGIESVFACMEPQAVVECSTIRSRCRPPITGTPC